MIADDTRCPLPGHGKHPLVTCSRCVREGAVTTYKIVRLSRMGYSQRAIKRGLSLEQAQEHCSDPETDSNTATSSAARRRTKRIGPWFDIYEKE
jgi:hypothetical protein